MRQKGEMVGGSERRGVRTRGSVPGPGIGMRWGGVGVKEKREPRRIVWYGGRERERRKNQSVIREDMGSEKVFIKLATRICVLC